MDKIFLAKKLGYYTKEIKTELDVCEMKAAALFCKIPYFAYDTETTGLNFIKDVPFLISFGFDKYVFYWEASNKEATYAMFEIIKIHNQKLFAHNAKYDYHMMINNGTKIPDDIELSDSITLFRLISSCDDEHASMRLEKLGEKYVDPDAKFASDIIKEKLMKIKAQRKKEVCANYKLLTGSKSYNDAWLNFTKRVNFITEYHEAFNDYKEPTYYDVFKEDRQLVIDYAIDDVVIILEFLKKAGYIYAAKYRKLDGTIDMRTLERENKLIRPIANMERNGFRVDVDYLIKSHYKILEFDTKLYEKLHSLTGENWNVGQHQKIKEFFKSKYNIILDKSDKKAIKELTHHSDPTVAEIAKLILKLRTVSKWLSTYIDGVLNKVVEVDGIYKLYTSINNNGAVSGRVSSDLQQMPKYAINETDDDTNELLLEHSLNDDEGNELFHPRRMIIPSDGYKLYFLDFSQVELRIQAFYTILTGNLDYHLCKAYMPYDCVNSKTGELFDYKNKQHIRDWGLQEDGKSIWIDNETGKPWVPTDLHTKTTLVAFPEFADKTDTKEFKKKWRYLGKQTNFAKNYGCGPKTLASNLGVDFEIAKKLSDGYNSSYPGVIKYQQAVQNNLIKYGYVSNLYGRRYYLENENNFYKANNYVIQGTGADMLKEIEIKIDDYLKNKKSRFILPIHDELAIEVAPEEESFVPHDIKEIMESEEDVMPYVPIVCEVEATDTTWADKSGVEV